MRPQFRIFRPDGVLVCSGQEQYAIVAETDRCLLAPSTTYTVLITDHTQGRTGSYQLLLQSLYHPVTRATLGLATRLDTSLAEVGELATVAVPISGRTVVNLRMGVGSGTLHPMLRLYSTRGTLICGTSSPFGTVVELSGCLIPEAGTYTLLATDATGSGTGGVGIVMQSLDAPVATTSLAPSVPASATLAGPGDLGSYVFWGAQGATPAFTLTITGDDCDRRSASTRQAAATYVAPTTCISRWRRSPIASCRRLAATCSVHYDNQARSGNYTLLATGILAPPVVAEPTRLYLALVQR